MSEEWEKGRQRHSGLLKALQGLSEWRMDTYKRDRLEGEGERKDRSKQTEIHRCEEEGSENKQNYEMIGKNMTKQWIFVGLTISFHQNILLFGENLSERWKRQT